MPLDDYRLVEISDTTDESDAYLIAYDNEGHVVIFHEMLMIREELPGSVNAYG